ncbi:MAG TPA: ABC transporter substrate-binding protein [Actinomycetaceae bacterium]|nr:ABC transporter substrate-binding protein [Actinomycetaceae bacterium]
MKKRMTTLATMAVATLALAACGGGTVEDPGIEEPADGGDTGAETETAEGGEADGDISIAIVSKGFQHQFWQAVQQGADEAAAELGVSITFEGPDDESQVDQQIQMLQTALDRGPDAIAFAALDSQAAEPLLQRADDSGIPIIAFDSGVDSDIPLTTVATDNYAAGGAAAEHMSELIGGEGKVALVVHDQTSVSGTERRDGFVDWMEENAPDVEIVDIQYGGGDHLESTDITRSIISAHSDLAGIFGSNEGSAIGVVNAINELNMAGEITVVGFDSGQAQIDAIRGGVMAGAITQNPVNMGYETVQAAVRALEGETLDEETDTGYLWYDADNIDDDEIQAAIYE